MTGPVRPVPGGGSAGIDAHVAQREGRRDVLHEDERVRELAAASDRTAFRSGPQQTFLFIEVGSIREVEQALAGERLVLPFRTTFYGAKELGYLDRAGNVVVFAEMAER